MNTQIPVENGSVLRGASLSIPISMHWSGPCGIPGLIPGSRFILDPDPDPGKLFSKPGLGSKPGFVFLYKFAQKFSFFKKVWQLHSNFQRVFDNF